METIQTREMAGRPKGYIGPNLNPEGLTLRSEKLGNGVYALLASEMPKDNNGVVVGEKAALVIDAGINGEVARQIQQIVRSITDKSIRYLVNTTYHGDHTFGNAAFPPEVTILSSHRNKLSMSDLATEKARRSGNLRGNLAALDEVTQWRKPDVTFTSDRLEIDLGGIVVELWYFGPGNAPGDTTVYVPSAKVAWTGNYLMAQGVPPMLLEGGTAPYIASLERFRDAIDAERIVPGHGPMGAAQPAIENFIAYMREIHQHVRQAIDHGLDADAVVEALPMSPLLHPPAGVTPDPNMAAMAPHLHRLNVMAEYRALTSNHETGEK
ncbi:MAG: MBL fold metallo-hydrolase [Lysobacterales bacterium]|jgi:cyclase